MNENNENPVDDEEEAEGAGEEPDEAEQTEDVERAAPAGQGAAGAQAAATLGLMRYVHAIFFAGAIALAWLFIQIVDTAWVRMYNAFGAIPTPRDWLTVALGAVGGFGMAFYMWRHPRVNRLAIEIVTELSKVSWPTRKELSASTVVVIVVSVIASIVLGVFDMFWAAATDWILKI